MKKRPGGPHVREEVEARAGGGATVDWELHMAASKSSKIGICEGSSVQLIHQAPRKYVSRCSAGGVGGGSPAEVARTIGAPQSKCSCGGGEDLLQRRSSPVSWLKASDDSAKPPRPNGVDSARPPVCREGPTHLAH